MSRILQVLAGAVIAAAFLGPGTVTTAASAGAAHGLHLLWALSFATAACWVLQEVAARLTIASGLPLGAALRRRHHGPMGLLTLIVVLGGIVVGCAAYEAGNILGGVAGAAMALDAGPGSKLEVSRAGLTALSGLLAMLLLAVGSTRVVVSVLGALVAAMGIAFTVTAWLVAPPLGELVAGLLTPTVPAGSGLLVLGLIGTTVVPYNLFLGSGLAQGRELGPTRLGLAIAIGLGGLVSMAVVVTGTAVLGGFSFDALAAVLEARLGGFAVDFFGWGLFAAGFSSAITAPLAAALTARGLFATEARDPRWVDSSWRFRGVWLTVLATGIAFGLSGIKPVPVILVAQALNGLLLPWVAAFLFLVVNDRRLMQDAVNGRFANLAMSTVLAVATTLGVHGLLRAAASVSGQAELASLGATLTISAAVLLVSALWIRRQLRG